MTSSLKNQVVSLELSKRLKELGVPQESHFYWSKDFDVNNEFTGEEPVVEEDRWLEYNEMEKAKVCSAFLVGELGEMIPMELKNRNGKCDGGYFETYRMTFKKWIVEYCQGKKVVAHIMGDTEADARAKMLIYLLENNLLKASDL